MACPCLEELIKRIDELGFVPSSISGITELIEEIERKHEHEEIEDGYGDTEPDPEELVYFLEKIEADNKLFELIARIARKHFNALIKTGFSEEQALKIITHAGISSML